MIYYHLARDMEKTGKYFENEILETPTHSVQPIEHKKLMITVEENMNGEFVENMNGEFEPIKTTTNGNGILCRVPNAGKGSFESAYDVQQDWQKGWLYYEAIRELLNESNTRFGPMLLLNHGAMFFVASSNIFSILRWYILCNSSNIENLVILI